MSRQMIEAGGGGLRITSRVSQGAFQIRTLLARADNAISLESVSQQGTAYFDLQEGTNLNGPLPDTGPVKAASVYPSTTSIGCDMRGRGRGRGG